MSGQLDLSKESILVTGGSGFLGSFVIKKLKERKARKINAPRSRDYDLVKYEHVKRIFDDFNPTVVIHLAAKVGGIGANRDNPGSFFYQNLMMGVQLIEEARQRNIKKFIALGTICAYPKFTPVPFREENLWDGYPEETNAPYGLAKKMLLVQSQAYRAQYSFNSIFLLPVNLYGPGDNFDLQTSHVIPAMIRKFYEAKQAKADTVTLWGDGSPTREFLYVEDCAEGIILATERYNSSDPVNLGTSFEISIRDLAELIKKKIGYTGTIVWDKSKPNGQPKRKLNITKAEKLFGFRAKTSFDDGLNKTIKWFISNYDKMK